VTLDQEQQLARLFVRAQDGDQHAYAEVLTQLTSLARGYVRARAGAAPWTDDAVQEILLTVHRARHTFDGRRPVAPWFYAIVRHRMIDILRRERRIGGREIGADVLPEVEATDPPTDTALAPELSAALAHLPKRQRVVVEALKLNDESVREVSRRLNMSEGAVKVTAHRGYAALRRALGVARR